MRTLDGVNRLTTWASREKARKVDKMKLSQTIAERNPQSYPAIRQAIREVEVDQKRKQLRRDLEAFNSNNSLRIRIQRFIGRLNKATA